MTASGAGGLQQSIVPYACALARRQHVVQLIMHKASPLLPDMQALGFQPQTVARTILPGGLARSVGRLLTEFVPDAVLGFASRGYPVARKAAPPGVPVLSHVGTMNAKRLKKLLTADGLIVTSREMQDFALSLGARRERLAIVPNFLIQEVRPVGRSVGLMPTVGSLGRLVHRKGYDVLLDAAARLKAEGMQFKLVIAGTGSEQRRLARQALRLGLNVDWPGWISNSSKASFLESLDIFVNPARDEPFGIVFIEAMSAGLPVVATDTVGARAIFEHGVDGLVVPQENPQELARAIGLLIRDKEQRSRIAAQGTAKYLESYHIEVAAGKLSAAIEAWTAQARK